MDVRATFVMQQEMVKQLRAFAKYKRVSQKDLLNSILTNFFKSKTKELVRAINMCGDETIKPPSNVISIKKQDDVALNARRATWAAYAQAYESRVKQPPIQNSKNNALIKQFVDRIGQKEAPEVIKFFVLHPEGRYVGRMYMLDLAVKDAESLRAQWANQSPITQKDVERFEARHDMANQRQRILQGDL